MPLERATARQGYGRPRQPDNVDSKQRSALSIPLYGGWGDVIVATVRAKKGQRAKGLSGRGGMLAVDSLEVRISKVSDDIGTLRGERRGSFGDKEIGY